MKVMVNGVERDLPQARTLAELLCALNVTTDRGGVAIAQNDRVIPRARWADTPVAEGDRLEIITAVQGC